MKFKAMFLEVWDPDSYRWKHVLERKVGKDEYLRTYTGEFSGIERQEVRRYTKATQDDDGDNDLLDWYEVWHPQVNVLGDSIDIQGFMRGLTGKRQDGLCVKHQEPYCTNDEDGEPFVLVRWTLR